MAKTKQKQKSQKKFVLNRTALIAGSVLLILALSLAVYIGRHSKTSVTNEQSAPTNIKESTNTSLTNPAVAEAKAKADEYFEAASNCDLERANSLRLLPKNITLSKEECQKECPGGLTYKYLKPVSYNSSESGGVTTEFAAFDYVFGCGDKTYPTLMQMVRSSDDKSWLVFNSF
ncbi:MAG: hypothetical protein V4702_00385 [Patescibacteria group bacterium]